MKTFYIPFVLLLVMPLAMTTFQSSAVPADLDPIEINYGLLKFKAKELPRKEIKDTFDKLNQLLVGEVATQMGLIAYKDEKGTIKQLIEIEAQLRTLNLTPEEKKQENAALKLALVSTIKHLRLATDPFKNAITKNKGFVIPMVERWIGQRNRKESPLLGWFKLTEAQFIGQYLKDFEGIDRFVEDFSLLLLDVQYTIDRYAPATKPKLREEL